MAKTMGIVNVTPDSFSDGGKYFRPEEAVRRAANMIDEGADFVDVGGESTRPGSTPLDWRTEWGRIKEPLVEIAALCEKKGVVLSVDTYHPETAREAVALGAKLVNCVYPEPAAEMAEICAGADVELVAPFSALDTLKRCGFPAGKLYLDPMIGFGTTREQDMELLRAIGEYSRGYRVLAGVSRKRIVKKLTGENTTGKNLGGCLGLAVWCVLRGASVVRVHDVKETVQALKVFEILGRPE